MTRRPRRAPRPEQVAIELLLLLLGAVSSLTACQSRLSRGDGVGTGTGPHLFQDSAPGTPSDLPQAPLDTGPAPACPAGNVAGTPPAGIVPGAVSLPHPTTSAISILWPVEGDANANAEVRVRFRKKGETGWRLAMPLVRVPAGSTPEGFSWPNRLAGSIFDLAPATSYEIELWLKDPDGGCRVEEVSTSTRPVPAPMPGAPVKPVNPASLSKLLADAVPGDILELAAGTYPGFTASQDGLPGKPIVIRSSASARVDGSIIVSNRKHVHLVGLTVENGRIRFDGSDSVAIIRCKVTASSAAAGDGIITWARAQDAYIADNEVIGETEWIEASVGASGDNGGEGILVNGPGHVVAHNRVRGFRDNISLVEGGQAVDQFSIDIIGNDLSLAADDGVEADFCQHNCRVLRNRFTNVFVAMSSQPGLGGPSYFIRNLVYSGIYVAAFKLHRGSVGDVALHNTIVKNGDALAVEAGTPHRRQHFRNNIFIGGPGAQFNGWSSGSGKVMNLVDAVDGSFDFDGFGSTTGSFQGKYAGVSFSSLAELRARTSEKHAVQVDLGIFAASISYPGNPFPARQPADLRLKPGSAAIDVGVIIPNVNDGYSGQAPDLGAIELGASLPVYGPR